MTCGARCTCIALIAFFTFCAVGSVFSVNPVSAILAVNTVFADNLAETYNSVIGICNYKLAVCVNFGFGNTDTVLAVLTRGACRTRIALVAFIALFSGISLVSFISFGTVCTVFSVRSVYTVFAVGSDNLAEIDRFTV